MALARRPAPAIYQAHYGDFIQSFLAKEKEEKEREKQRVLSAAERAAHRETLNKVQSLQPHLSENAEYNIAGALRRWKVYCAFNSFGDWKEKLKHDEVECSLLEDHLDWMCNTLRITSSGTSWEYWRQFKQLYRIINGCYVNLNFCDEVKKYHDGTLVIFYDLRAPASREKPVVGLPAAKSLVIYNLAKDTRVFRHERRRSNLWLFYLFLSVTGARMGEFCNNERKPPKEHAEVFGPAALVMNVGEGPLDPASHLFTQMVARSNRNRGRPKALCYEDLLLTVVRNPETGKDVVVLVMKLIHHKGEDRKPRPTIYFLLPSKAVLYCPVTGLVAHALSDNAFESRLLTSAERVFSVRNRPPVQCTPLLWKEEWLKRPVFRKADASGVSPDEAVPYHVVNGDLHNQSLDDGNKTPLTGCAWRRWRANNLNGDAPDAVRDQVMRHDARWTTFFEAYLSRGVQWDVVHSALEESLEDKLIAELSHVNLGRDPRAAKDMVPDEVWDKLPPDPEIEELKQERARLKGGQYRIAGQEYEEEVKGLTDMISALVAKRRTAFQQWFHDNYFKHRPTWDVDLQFRGEAEEVQDEYTEPVVDLRIPERAELTRLLCGQRPGLSDEELRLLRIAAADLWAALGKRREKYEQPRTRRRQQQLPVRVKQESPQPEIFPLLMMPSQCPDCIGDPSLPTEQRMFAYCRPSVMYDHFDDAHLGVMERVAQSGGSIVCKHPACREEPPLQHLDHYRNHVAAVHNVRLRSADDARARRAQKLARRRPQRRDTGRTGNGERPMAV